jgi:hypothetical protein
VTLFRLDKFRSNGEVPAEGENVTRLRPCLFEVAAAAAMPNRADSTKSAINLA